MKSSATKLPKNFMIRFIHEKIDHINRVIFNPQVISLKLSSFIFNRQNKSSYQVPLLKQKKGFVLVNKMQHVKEGRVM